VRLKTKGKIYRLWKGDVKMKRARSGEASYADVCRCEGSDRETVYDHMDSDDREEWGVV
jgi:hypothetical protein